MHVISRQILKGNIIESNSSDKSNGRNSIDSSAITEYEVDSTP